MSQVKFLIEDNIPIPKRTVNFAPRDSQYDQLSDMSPGQSFVIQITGRTGQVHTDKATGKKHTLTVEEDAKKQATQKQSYLSAYTRRHGIKVVSRFFANDEKYGPHLRVWHDGYRPADENASAEQDGDGDVVL